jgi:hypothetical protein
MVRGVLWEEDSSFKTLEVTELFYNLVTFMNIQALKKMSYITSMYLDFVYEYQIRHASCELMLPHFTHNLYAHLFVVH